MKLCILEEYILCIDPTSVTGGTPYMMVTVLHHKLNNLRNCGETLNGDSSNSFKAIWHFAIEAEMTMKKPLATPSLISSYFVVMGCALAGAAIVHNIFKPNLSIPKLENEHIAVPTAVAADEDTASTMKR